VTFNIRFCMHPYDFKTGFKMIDQMCKIYEYKNVRFKIHLQKSFQEQGKGKPW
jgi:hypothetical protein